MMSRLARALLALFLLLPVVAAAAPAAEDARVALVIGNADYPSSPLRNPVNDARAIAAQLKALGFDVLLRENLDQRGMVEAAREFATRIREGGVALFYFAGHGVQVAGRNYLVPARSDIRAEDEVPYMSLDANQILDKMERARSRVNVVILDACRNNPFARSSRSAAGGLAQMDAPSGTLIAFATAPGSVASDGDGPNSTYTTHLLRTMVEPGLPVELMFKRVREAVTADTRDAQVPWESSSLKGDFYFSKPRAAAYANQPQAVGTDPLAVELAYWDTVKDSTIPGDLEAYLRRYPEGNFAALARNRIEHLKLADSRTLQVSPPVAAPQPAPPPAPVALIAPASPAVTAPTTASAAALAAAASAGETWVYGYRIGWPNKPRRRVVRQVVSRIAGTVGENIAQTEPAHFERYQEFHGQPAMVETRVGDFVLFEFAPHLAALGKLDETSRWSEIPMLTGRDPDGWVYRGKVVGREKVTVPAGTFDTLKVEVTGRRNAYTEADKVTMTTLDEHVIWYSEQLKRPVKQTRKLSAGMGDFRDLETLELLEYRSRGAPATPVAAPR